MIELIEHTHDLHQCHFCYKRLPDKISVKLKEVSVPYRVCQGCFLSLLRHQLTNKLRSRNKFRCANCKNDFNDNYNVFMNYFWVCKNCNLKLVEEIISCMDMS